MIPRSGGRHGGGLQPFPKRLIGQECRLETRSRAYDLGVHAYLEVRGYTMGFA